MRPSQFTTNICRPLTVQCECVCVLVHYRNLVQKSVKSVLLIFSNARSSSSKWYNDDNESLNSTASICYAKLDSVWCAGFLASELAHIHNWTIFRFFTIATKRFCRGKVPCSALTWRPFVF